MKEKRLKIFILLVSAIFLFACGITPAPVVIPPEQLGTSIVQTAALLASQTALYAPPTLVSTATITGIPSSTPTLTETVTPFIVTLVTRTSTITPTGTSTATRTPTKTLIQPCMVVAVVPENNQQFGSGAFFDTNWTVVNTGSVTWAQGNVDFVYQAGTRMHLNGDILDLPAKTAPSQSLSLVVHMQAPATKGTYSETWSLIEGNAVYCTVSMVIIVK